MSIELLKISGEYLALSCQHPNSPDLECLPHLWASLQILQYRSGFSRELSEHTHLLIL